MGRAIPRTPLGTATAAILAVTTAAPTHTATDGPEPRATLPLSWKAMVNHSGTTGNPVTLKAVLADANGISVTRIVTRAYDVR